MTDSRLEIGDKVRLLKPDLLGFPTNLNLGREFEMEGRVYGGAMSYDEWYFSDSWIDEGYIEILNQRVDSKSIQVGGDWYKNLAIQPIDFILGNGLGFCEGNVIKYVTRWKHKNGIEDLEKAKHYIDMLIAAEGSKDG
jgi:hypothetical protein